MIEAQSLSNLRQRHHSGRSPGACPGGGRGRASSRAAGCDAAIQCWVQCLLGGLNMKQGRGLAKFSSLMTTLKSVIRVLGKGFIVITVLLEADVFSGCWVLDLVLRYL